MRTMFVAVLLIVFCTFKIAYGVDETIPETAQQVQQQTGSNVLGFVWEQLNTTFGLAFIAGVWSWIIARLFTKKPKWKQYYDQYKGHIIEAIKLAEKGIPDGTEDKSAKRIDMALKYILALTQDTKTNTDDVKQAIKVAHAELEASKNI
ncbi:MAG: hypothetical protein DRN14_03875 [Thermoplasmata archaeon]|nr:MAG: hypothetical protein DRN14_03875 [Thermoplasmata archaeon]